MQIGLVEAILNLETSGKLSRVYVNLRSTDSSLLESELAIVKAVSDESTDVDFVLGHDVLRQIFHYLGEWFICIDERLQRHTHTYTWIPA